MIGGQEAEPGTFPWMAYVLDREGGRVGQCSGTVVSPNLILTAGHCAENVRTGAVDEASGYRVVTGNVDWAAPATERQVSAVTRVIPCPCFDRNTGVGDVALLELSTPTTAPAITLAASPGAGGAAVFAGWGETYYNQPGQVEALRWAPTIVQSADWCEREAPPFSPQSESCVIDAFAHHTGPCFGDSGGPLLLREPAAVGGLVQIGVANRASAGCATAYPSIFMRVAAVSGWVRGWIQALADASSASASMPNGGVAAPSLAGLASVRSLSIAGRLLSLTLGCDDEGGVCEGDLKATITVREELVAGHGATPTVRAERTRTVMLAAVGFGVAPGYSTAARAPLSPQADTLLARLGRRPFDIVLAGPGVEPRVVTLQPGGST